MNEIDDLEPTYNKCQADGAIKFKKKIDDELIKSIYNSALEGQERIRISEHSYEKKSGNYAFLFTEQYDILRKLIDAFLLCNKVNCNNHQCGNAYLCTVHSDLDFDWEILESIRKLRNGIQYKGKQISEELWKSHKLKFEVYINSLIKILDKKISEA